MDGTPELEVKVELHPHVVVPNGTQAEDVELPFPDELDDASPAAKEPDQIVEQRCLFDLDTHDLGASILIIDLCVRAGIARPGEGAVTPVATFESAAREDRQHVLLVRRLVATAHVT
jgi:hypothetical protein